MMMPIFPGAPWLPKFQGKDGEIKYCEWKEQIMGLLGTQEFEVATSVAIIIGALGGEPKRQVNVLEPDERNTVRKVFVFLDSFYGNTTPIAVLRSQFFSCVQRPSESLPSFLLRLRELHSRLRQHDPDGPPSAGALRDRLLLGLRESPLSQALKVYARRHPDEDFTALRREALLLEDEYRSPSEITCAAVNNSYTRSHTPPPQDTDWKETMKREIMEDVKSQMKGLAQELMKEIRPLLQSPPQPPPHTSNADAPPSMQPRRESPPVPYSNEWDDQGRPICRKCRKAGHISRFCRSRNNAQSPLN